MNVDILHRTDRPTDVTATQGPFARIVVASLGAGLATALTLSLVVFAGHTEATVTGAMLVGFGFGWTLIGVLSRRLADRSQRWTAVPAVAMGGTGLGLVVFAPGDGAMSSMSWVWPAPMLALAVYVWARARRELPGRARWMLVPVVAVMTIAPVAATYENVSVVRDHHTYTAPGTTYEVNGHRLYLDCRGQGSPTVVLDNGLGEVTASWARIVDQVDTTTRVCAYDRAGQGWSQGTSGAQDGVAAAHELHDLLNLAGEHGPYLLVGHSIGGTYALTYAAQYPQQVAGMVLLDSSSPEQFTAIPSYSGQYAVIHRVEALTPTLNRLGLGRVIAAVASSHLPTTAAGQVTALTANAQGARNASAEWQVLPTLFKQAQALTTFGHRPLAVLTASESAQKTGGWEATQNRLAALSTRSIHRVVDSTHMGLLEDPHGSAAAVAAIDHVIAELRNQSPRGTR
ncbi:MAG: alpha/beta hydrolase fold protein [Nocardioides sp.]|nr:alpha/beta hydrolase fold protein [Nocardioides sp.]